MTVETTTNVAIHTGNGVADTFPFSFKVLDVDHLTVERRVLATGLVDKTYTAEEFSVTGIGDNDGEVTLTDGPLEATYQIIITRTVPYKQEVDIVNQGGFYPDTVERQLDDIVMQVQQIAELAGRTIRFAKGESPAELGAAAARAGYYLTFDAEGNPAFSTGPGSDSALRTDLVASSGSALSGFLPSGLGANARSVQSKLRDEVSIFDFMTPVEIAAAQAGTVADLTTHFVNAQVAAKLVRIPAGTYGLDGLRILSGRSFIGAGTEATIIKQYAAGNPAINCKSNGDTVGGQVVGQIKGVCLKGFKVQGHATATAAAVRLSAAGVYAIWDSEFEFFAKDTFRALELVDQTANNVFRCAFRVSSEGTSNTAVYTDGGVYNEFDLFLVQCAQFAVQDASWSSRIRAVSDGLMTYSGQINDIWAVVEELHAAVTLLDVVISDSGFFNYYHRPTVILTGANAGKVTYPFQPYYGTTFNNPQQLGDPVTHPIKRPNTAANFTVIGGRFGSASKAEVLFDDSAANAMYDQITTMGDVSDWTDYPSTALETIAIEVGDETTAITVGTTKKTFRLPYAFYVRSVRASVTTAPVGSTIIIDINEGGTTILSTKLSIDASEKTSTTAASAAVISDRTLASDAEMTIDFDQVGSGTAGAGVKVYLVGHRIVA